MIKSPSARSTNFLLAALCQFPHRGAATANERAAAQLLADALTERGATARLEPFQTPKTYVTIVYWLIGGLLAGMGLAMSAGFLLQQIGLVVALFFLVQAWLYFNWRPTLISRWPVQHTALNVVARWPRPDAEPVRTHVVLMAHYDTAPVSALYSPRQQRSFRASLMLSLAIMTLGVALLVVYVAAGWPGWVTWGVGLVALYLIAQAVMGSIGYWTRGYTNGASDNATGVVAAIETADRLQRASLAGELPGLLVEVLLPSAEEAGMLGSLAYAQKNRPKWPLNGQQTIVINFDTLGAGKLTVVEQTGTVEVLRYDNALTQLARQLTATAAFRERTQTGRWHTADFDSAWFVRGGNVPTLALCALAPDGSMPRIHRPDDVLAAVDETPMNTAIDFAEAVVRVWHDARNP
ncbi:peptidase M28 [Fibrella aestuarina BUZ 2]|uniref:Peptidase M28 n=1 Tax=Fibrella aestuarina BUZ 2 TaxID=1166018 RepID=I0KB27_9BACT|nr:M28 family peptidase [Fibrella aestuarina]CCH01330.1 peptidase M28 [Fibrella aestuarina BUZ 2]